MEKTLETRKKFPLCFHSKGINYKTSKSHKLRRGVRHKFGCYLTHHKDQCGFIYICTPSIKWLGRGGGGGWGAVEEDHCLLKELC